jgi:hypothetical protein
VPVVTMTAPAATNARTMQAVVPPTIHGPDRARLDDLPRPKRTADGSVAGAADSEGCRHRRSSGEIHPSILSRSASSPGSSPVSPPEAHWSSLSTLRG